jgi:hypothetical protein
MKWDRPEPGKLAFFIDDEEAEALLIELYHSFCSEDALVAEYGSWAEMSPNSATYQLYQILAACFQLSDDKDVRNAANDPYKIVHNMIERWEYEEARNKNATEIQ